MILPRTSNINSVYQISNNFFSYTDNKVIIFQVLLYWTCVNNLDIFLYQVLIPMEMWQNMSSNVNVTATVKRSPMKSVKPRKTGSLALFFRKVRYCVSDIRRQGTTKTVLNCILYSNLMQKPVKSNMQMHEMKTFNICNFNI